MNGKKVVMLSSEIRSGVLFCKRVEEFIEREPSVCQEPEAGEFVYERRRLQSQNLNKLKQKKSIMNQHD